MNSSHTLPVSAARPLMKPISTPRTLHPAASVGSIVRSNEFTPPAPTMIELAKTLFDRPFAAMLLVLFAPVIALMMLAVKATSRGPALYTQSRIGRGGRSFTIYKIRTMHHECESLTGPRWSMPGDPRITPLGKFLRAVHLDELPQLWNVVIGDMAMVGPRPERPEICRRLRGVIRNYDIRHTVKPGITGFAQIHLPPDSCVRSVRNKVAYDRFYIHRMSPMMDFYVYFCTALKLLGLRRCYLRAPLKPVEE